MNTKRLSSYEEKIEEAADEYVLDMFGWIDPEQLLPDRCGEYKVIVESDNEVHTSRFNKRMLFSYWSIEHFCHEKVIGWKPLIEYYISGDDND